MTYVDGFVLIVPKRKRRAYRKMASIAEKMWRKHGALDYKECVGDELNPDTQGMPFLSFPKLTKAKKDELVFFSFIVYKNKAHRNKVNKAVMKDPAMKDSPKEMPFDMKKMAWGGFKTVVGK